MVGAHACHVRSFQAGADYQHRVKTTTAGAANGAQAA